MARANFAQHSPFLVEFWLYVGKLQPEKRYIEISEIVHHLKPCAALSGMITAPIVPVYPTCFISHALVHCIKTVCARCPLAT